MATKLLNQDDAYQNVRQFRIFDDFVEFVDGTVWDVTKDTTTTVAVDADGVGGLLLMTTNSADNDEAYIDTLEVFKVATDKPIFCLMRAKLACVTDNQADMIFGLMDAVGANAIADGSTVATGKHMAVLFKPDGVATLTAQSTSSAAGTYNASTSEISIDEDFATYGILVEPVSSTDKRITYYYDPDGGSNWQQLRDTNNNLIQHTWSLADTSAATGELSLMAGVKAGSAEAQVLTIDYIGAWQLR